MKMILAYLWFNTSKIKSSNFHSFFFWNLKTDLGQICHICYMLSYNFPVRMILWWVFPVAYVGDQVCRLWHQLAMWGHTPSGTLKGLGIIRLSNTLWDSMSFQPPRAGLCITQPHLSRVNLVPWMSRPLTLLVKMHLQRVGGDCRNILYLFSMDIPWSYREEIIENRGGDTYLNYRVIHHISICINLFGGHRVVNVLFFN